MTGEMPVWVSGQQLWITGVNKKTTCSDVVCALLGRADDNYGIIERWRKVERPLDADTKILKVWSAWGEQGQSEVKLTLRKLNDDDSGRGSPCSSIRKKHCRRSATATHAKQSQTLHPKRLAQLSKSHSIERLLKLILVQGETIQSQLKRLHDKENQIDQLVVEKHRCRQDILGSNYLLKTYLGEEADNNENDSGVVTEAGPSGSSENTSPTGEAEVEVEETKASSDDADELAYVEKQIHMLEKIIKVNKKLEKEEENLVRLFISIQRYQNNKQTDAHSEESAELLERLNAVKLELENGSKELEKNSLDLVQSDQLLNMKRNYLKKLRNNLNMTDNENEQLKVLSDSRSDSSGFQSPYDYPLKSIDRESRYENLPLAKAEIAPRLTLDSTLPSYTSVPDSFPSDDRSISIVAEQNPYNLSSKPNFNLHTSNDTEKSSNNNSIVSNYRPVPAPDSRPVGTHYLSSCSYNALMCNVVSERHNSLTPKYNSLKPSNTLTIKLHPSSKRAQENDTNSDDTGFSSLYSFNTEKSPRPILDTLV